MERAPQLVSELLYLLVWLKLQCLGDCDVNLGPGDCRLLWAGLTPVSLCMVREPDWTHVYMLVWTPVSWSLKQETGSEARDPQGSCKVAGPCGLWNFRVVGVDLGEPPLFNQHPQKSGKL